MSFDLTNKNIQDTFQNLLQKTGSEGKLFDLVGNEITDLTIGGTLTAHSYITSESIVNTSSGSTAFGNSSDDTHKFIGNITASGKISASDDIKGKNFLGKIGSFGVGTSNQPDPTIPSNNDIQLFVTRNGSTAQALIERVGNGELLLTAGASDVEVGTRNNYPLHLIHNNTDRVKIDAGGIDVIGHITASGNISSSENLLGSFVGIDTDTAVQSSKLQINSGHLGMSDAHDIFFGAARNTKIVGSQAASYMKFLVAGTERLALGSTNTFTGNISASGHISASKFVGDGSELTGLSSAAISSYTNNGNNRVVTSVDANTVNGEANLTFDGTELNVDGNITANSGSFNYITASIVDVDGDTIRFGGEPFTKANIQTLKLGRSLKPLRVGKSRPDFEAEDGSFLGDITASGNLTIDGDVDFKKDLDVDGITNLDNTFIDGNLIVDTNTLRVNSISNRVGISVNTPSEKLEVANGNIKISNGDLNASAGAVSASKINVTTNDTDDFFLLKSGSMESIKVNGQGVLTLGGFTLTPTAVRGGLYYNHDDDEFYLGKNN